MASPTSFLCTATAYDKVLKPHLDLHQKRKDCLKQAEKIFLAGKYEITTVVKFFEKKPLHMSRLVEDLTKVWERKARAFVAVKRSEHPNYDALYLELFKVLNVELGINDPAKQKAIKVAEEKFLKATRIALESYSAEELDKQIQENPTIQCKESISAAIFVETFPEKLKSAAQNLENAFYLYENSDLGLEEKAFFEPLKEFFFSKQFEVEQTKKSLQDQPLYLQEVIMNWGKEFQALGEKKPKATEKDNKELMKKIEGLSSDTLRRLSSSRERSLCHKKLDRELKIFYRAARECSVAERKHFAHHVMKVPAWSYGLQIQVATFETLNFFSYVQSLDRAIQSYRKSSFFQEQSKLFADLKKQFFKAAYDLLTIKEKMLENTIIKPNICKHLLDLFSHWRDFEGIPDESPKEKDYNVLYRQISILSADKVESLFFRRELNFAFKQLQHEKQLFTKAVEEQSQNITAYSMAESIKASSITNKKEIKQFLASIPQGNRSKEYGSSEKKEE